MDIAWHMYITHLGALPLWCVRLDAVNDCVYTQSSLRPHTVPFSLISNLLFTICALQTMLPKPLTQLSVDHAWSTFVHPFITDQHVGAKFWSFIFHSFDTTLQAVGILAIQVVFHSTMVERTHVLSWLVRSCVVVGGKDHLGDLLVVDAAFVVPKNIILCLPM